MNGIDGNQATRSLKNRKIIWFKLFDEYLIWILVLLTLLITTIFLREFFRPQNILNILSNSAILGIMVIA